MKELSPEVQVALIDAAHEVAITFADSKAGGKKANKSFARVYLDTFEKTYNQLVDLMAKPET